MSQQNTSARKTRKNQPLKLPEAKQLIADFLKFADFKDVASQIITVGSVRRGNPDIYDLDLFWLCEDEVLRTEFLANLRSLFSEEDILAFGTKQVRLVWRKFQVELSICHDAKLLGAALIHYTGNQLFNVNIRRKALSRGMQLSQLGLRTKDGILLPSDTEEIVLKQLGMNEKYVDPRYRTIDENEIPDRIWYIKSSNSKDIYTVTKKDDEFKCTCPGFIFRRKCKHVEGLKKNE